MDILITLLAVAFLAFLTVVGLAVWGVRAVGRRAARARADIRRTFTDAVLNARAAQPGAVGEAARTRKELRATLDSTRAALRADTESDAALAEARVLFDQLTGHAQQLDRELGALITGEPDRGRVAARLPDLRTRAERIRRSADALRFAAQERAHRHDAEALDVLHEQIDLEADALRHWAPAPEP
ncbi:hypothetical protein, partial [Streptomyces hainanensis]